MAIPMSRHMLAGAAVAALVTLGVTSGLTGSLAGKLGLDAGQGHAIVQPVNADSAERPRDRDVRAGRDGVEVEAPHTRVETDKGEVRVEAPFTSVERSDRGVRVRAPFVDIHVPR